MARTVKTTQPKAKTLSRIRPIRPRHEQEARRVYGCYQIEIYNVWCMHKEGQFESIVTAYIYDERGGLLAEAKFSRQGFYAQAVEYWSAYDESYVTSCDVNLGELGNLPQRLVLEIAEFESQTRNVLPTAEELAEELAKGEFEGILAERGARDAFARRQVEALGQELEARLRKWLNETL